MPLLQEIVLPVFPALAVWAGLKDATSYTIPNRVTIAVAAAFVPAALIAGLPLPQVGVALLAGLAALVAGMAMFAFGWIGGGDAKLFAGCALWLGVPAVVPFMLWTGIAGGLLAVGLLYLRKLPRPAYATGPAWAARLLTPGESVPYGVAIAAGALIAYPGSGLMRLAHG